MANTYLVEIGMNDQLQDVIRKCNHNFKQSAASSIRRTANETVALQDDIQNQLSVMYNEIENLRDRVAELEARAGISS